MVAQANNLYLGYFTTTFTGAVTFNFVGDSKYFIFKDEKSVNPFSNQKQWLETWGLISDEGEYIRFPETSHMEENMVLFEKLI